ncbi:MAG: VOC family protein [Lautropia sp.]
MSFRPRRLGHVNLWVSDLEKSVDFYESVCGIELVRRERAILIAFHSNGNTHHDVGIVEISRGKDRYGRDGMLQIPKTRGLQVGLNHLGWEMATEARLVEALRRAGASNYPLGRTVDHMISHSVYLNDPDGNGHEFYADQMRDWERIYNLANEDEVTGEWDPLAQPPSDAHNYNDGFRVRRVERAPLHPSHLTGTRFATRRFDEMAEFFTSVAGLDRVGERNVGGHRDVRLAGAIGRTDITLSEAADGEPVGLRSFRFALAEPHDLPDVATRIAGLGHRAWMNDGELCVEDPDGFQIEFHHQRA